VRPDSLDRYLDAVAEAQRRHRDVLFVPGVEVVPHYRWSGSPLSLELTLHDTQKNVLVFGLRDRAALERLPIPGNPNVRTYGWQSVLDALPVLLVVPGALLIVRKQTRRMRVGRAVALIRRRRWGLGVGVLALGLVALARGWPFTVDRYPYWTNPGIAPHQDLFDHVESAGGVAVWSFPEARDEGEHRFGPVLVRRLTHPYPDDLLRSARFTGFGAVYEDTTTFERPGGGWDRLLSQHAAGERRRPAWAIGESGFHEVRAGKQLGNARTVFLGAERSPAGLLEALRAGRMYALRRTPELGLELGEFVVAAAGAEAATGATLRAPADAPLDVRIGVVASDGGGHAIRVTLVRNGAVVGGWNATTPFRVVHRATVGAGRAFYRLDVRGPRPHHLLTNPVFVEAS
jgi:hypothetical protein